MRINFLLLLASVVAVQQISAQTVLESDGLTKSSDIRYAVKAGFNIAGLKGKGITDNRSLFGFHVGGAADIPVRDQFYFQPEALISFQGSGGVGQNLNLTYLTVPLMGKYYIVPKIAAEFGPQFGIKIADNSEDFGNVGLKTFDFALNFGGGYRLNDHFYFQLRYVLGLTDVFQEINAKNGVFQFGACYFF